ncbi:MAG: hypothetical protein AAB649_07450, partial [Patescibacteria group bacterium]
YAKVRENIQQIRRGKLAVLVGCGFFSMNRKEIKTLLAQIKQHVAKRDYEAACNVRDELYVQVLRAIAERRTRNPQALAALALSSEHPDINNWFVSKWLPNLRS